MNHQSSGPEPPLWALKFLRWFCASRFHEEIEGDLYELFLEKVEESGIKKARRTFPLFMFAYLRPYFFGKRQFFQPATYTITMLMNTLKIAIRQMKIKPIYSLINIFGLSLGLAASLLIFFFIQDELSFDQFHEKKDRIYRIGSDSRLPNSPLTQSARCSRLVAPVLRKEYPEVASVVRLYDGWDLKLTFEQQYFEHDLFFTESDFFSVFSFPLIYGDPEVALAEPNSVVITRETAYKYFHTDQVIGKVLVFDDSMLFNITGVVADPPVHSHFTFDMLMSFSTWENRRNTNIHEWGNYWIHTYCLLKEEASFSNFQEKIKEMVRDHYGQEMDQFGLDMTLHAEPLTDIHLYSRRTDSAGKIGDIRYVYIFAAVAVFLLLIACVNFVNLSTARSLDRAKEVGIKKAIGSYRIQLIQQFLVESVFISILSVILGLAMAAWFLPIFNSISGKSADIGALFSPTMLTVALGLAITIGILAGSYPAWVLSSFRPVEVLRGKWSSASQGLMLRKGLIVFQFAISIMLIIASMVVYGQLQYMQNQKLGFEKDKVVVVDGHGPGYMKISENHQTIKSDLLAASGILHASVSSRVPGAGKGGGVMYPEGLPEGESRQMSYFSVDEDFLPTMGIELLAGRNFSSSFETDASQAAIINETAVRNIGWSSAEEAIGKEIIAGFNGKPLNVIGVFKDYHHISLREEIEPTLLLIRPSWYAYFSIKINTSEIKSVLKHLESVWEERFPGHTFTYFFLDEFYGRQYQAEQKLTQIFGFFTSLAILIACIGLFGLTMFTVHQRSKEIGIRKVLGSSPFGIVVLLSKEFLVLIGISFAIAAPTAFFAMDYWLEDFAYRMTQSVWTFAWAGLGALVFAMVAIGFQTFKAAIADPAGSLKYE